MPISVTCGRCATRFSVPDAALGKQGNCPRCGGLIVVEDSTNGLDSDHRDQSAEFRDSATSSQPFVSGKALKNARKRQKQDLKSVLQRQFGPLAGAAARFGIAGQIVALLIAVAIAFAIGRTTALQSSEAATGASPNKQPPAQLASLTQETHTLTKPVEGTSTTSTSTPTPTLASTSTPLTNSTSTATPTPAPATAQNQATAATTVAVAPKPVKFEIQGMHIGDPFTDDYQFNYCPVIEKEKSFWKCSERSELKIGSLCVLRYFQDGKLIGVGLQFDPKIYPSLVEAYTQKFGVAPHGARSEKITTKAGAEDINEIVTWKTEDGPFQLRKYESAGDKGGGELSTKALVEHTANERDAEFTALKSKL